MYKIRTIFCRFIVERKEIASTDYKKSDLQDERMKSASLYSALQIMNLK